MKCFGVCGNSAAVEVDSCWDLVDKFDIYTGWVWPLLPSLIVLSKFNYQKSRKSVIDGVLKKMNEGLGFDNPL